MISLSQKTEFTQNGILTVENLIPKELAEAAQDVYFDFFGKKGIYKKGEWLLDEYPSTVPINTSAILAKELKHRKEFADVLTPAVETIVQELLDGEASSAMTNYPQLLFTLPNSKSWVVPLGPWHVDVPRFPEGKIPGVQVFTFLDNVQPGSGGTLAVAGSHRLLNDGTHRKSKEIARELQKLDFFEDLMTNESLKRNRLLDEIGRVDGIDVQVKELTGKPGDVSFMDMRIVHTIGPNAGNSPRAMLTQRYIAEKFRNES